MFRWILLSLEQSINHENVIQISNYYISNEGRIEQSQQWLLTVIGKTWIVGYDRNIQPSIGITKPLFIFKIKYKKCDILDRMVVGFRTTYAISAYHYWCCEFEYRLGRGVQHYVIRFVRDLRQVGGFLRYSGFLPNKTDRHDITEILLNVALNTTNQTKKQTNLITLTLSFV